MQLVKLLVRHDCPFSGPVRTFTGLRVTHLCHRGSEAVLEAHGESVDDLDALLESYRRAGGELLLRDEENPAALVRFERCACCRSGKVIPTVESRGSLYLPPSSYAADGETYQFLVPKASLDRAAIDTLSRDVDLVEVGTRPLESLGFEESFLVPAGALFRTLTPRQRAALVAALAQGYYRIPRATSTKELASQFGVSREAFDTLLRKAERKLLGAVFPYLAGSSSSSGSLPPNDPP